MSPVPAPYTWTVTQSASCILSEEDKHTQRTEVSKSQMTELAIFARRCTAPSITQITYAPAKRSVHAASKQRSINLDPKGQDQTHGGRG